jgi:glycosyltransferase involved in cell wall biosynthesis
MKSILILLHCESNTGYAIGPLEATFYEMALDLCGRDPSRIHFAYPSMVRGPSTTLPENFNQYAVIDSRSLDPEHHAQAGRYLREHDIDTIFGFDQPVTRPIYKHFRSAGIKHFIAYWGAPMSSVNSWGVRLLKRLEVALRRDGPDHYIFESRGMAETATLGRGIPAHRTSVVYLGIDTDRFRPEPADAGRVYECLSVPAQRRIFFYAGHMEPRKGVAAIMEAANHVAGRRDRDDWHILLFGNKGDEHLPYFGLLTEKARQHVTFGGYRSDLNVLQRGCYAAVIASTGWDSFPRSGIEMQASGLPLLVSDLRGLRESVDDGVSGLVFPTGNSVALAAAMERLLDDGPLRERLSRQARRRIETGFSAEIQLRRLTEVVQRVVG